MRMPPLLLADHLTQPPGRARAQNFDDNDNWYNPDQTAAEEVSNPTLTGAAAPKVVRFGGKDGSFEPINVRMPSGKYAMNKVSNSH